MFKIGDLWKRTVKEGAFFSVRSDFIRILDVDGKWVLIRYGDIPGQGNDLHFSREYLADNFVLSSEGEFLIYKMAV
jgi:hypothetical protein